MEKRTAKVVFLSVWSLLVMGAAYPFPDPFRISFWHVLFVVAMVVNAWAITALLSRIGEPVSQDGLVVDGIYMLVGQTTIGSPTNYAAQHFALLIPKSSDGTFSIAEAKFFKFFYGPLAFPDHSLLIAREVLHAWGPPTRVLELAPKQ